MNGFKRVSFFKGTHTKNNKKLNNLSGIKLFFACANYLVLFPALIPLTGNNVTSK